MTKGKTLKKLEALIDALEFSKKIYTHNPAETELVINKIIDYQTEYKKITGGYYSISRRVDEQTT